MKENNIPILDNKSYDQRSVFMPENLLREARRQRNLSSDSVPRICVLDPDGDIVRNLLKAGNCSLNSHWACYHSQMYNFELNDSTTIGIVGCVVGSSYAVLVAEEMFACGCELLISITSAGQIQPLNNLPCFVVVEKALRDEGTSYHYLAPLQYSEMKESCLSIIKDALHETSWPVYFGSTWTTDAPFRETEVAIEYARSEKILAVEMEAAALYAFAKAKDKEVICIAHVTNEMGKEAGDFEKGEADGSRASLEIITKIIDQWASSKNKILKQGEE